MSCNIKWNFLLFHFLSRTKLWNLHVKGLYPESFLNIIDSWNHTFYFSFSEKSLCVSMTCVKNQFWLQLRFSQYIFQKKLIKKNAHRLKQFWKIKLRLLKFCMNVIPLLFYTSSSSDFLPSQHHSKRTFSKF